MPNLAESLLARLTDRPRAAAIMGDLDELAASRGRLWFVAAYTRTLVSLGGRTGAAFLIAVASVRIMCLVYPWWVHHDLGYPIAEWPVSMFFGRLAVACNPFLNALAMCLWFALPFAWVRFGLRDRLTRFACVLFFCTLPVFSFQTLLIGVSSILTLLALVAALLFARWRRPFALLALTSATMIAALFTFSRLIAFLAIGEHRSGSISMFHGIGWLAPVFALALAAFVCSRLHHRLLRRRPVLT